MNTRDEKAYQKYIQSEQWQKKREERLRIDGFRCAACGSSGNVNNPLAIHHLNYKNLGHENVYTELVTVCKSCHSILHGALSRPIDENGTRGWRDSLPISTIWETLSYSTKTVER